MQLINVYFMRKDGRQKRGYIADVPTNAKCSYVDPFIICQTDEKKISADILSDNTVRLDLDKLMARYPNTEQEYTDDEGNSNTFTVYGYFHAEGRSNMEDLPIITLDNILRG